MGRLNLVGTEEKMNIRLEVCEFKPQITTFYVQNASLYSQYIIHIAKPKFNKIRI